MMTIKRAWRRYGIEPAIVLLSLLIVLFFFSIVHDDYGSFFLNMVSGQYSDFAFFDIFWLGMFGVNTIYKFLHQHFPAYDWMGTSFLVLTLTSLYLLLRTVRYVLERFSFTLGMIVCCELLFAMLFMENIIIISHTRFSLLFCGIAVFNFAFRQDLGRKEFGLYAVVFVLGLLHRPESGPGMLVLATIGFFVNNTDFRTYIRRAWFPLLFTASMLAYMSFDRITSHDFVKRIEPEVEYKLMGRRIVDLSQMKTETDSVKYQIATTGMWFDFKTITPEYLRSLLLPGVDLSTKHIKEVLDHILSYYRFFCVIWAFYAFFACAILLYGDNKRAIFKIILFQLGVILLLICLDFTGFLVDHRHFLNIQLVALLISLWFFAGAGFSVTPLLLSRPVVWILLAVILLSMGPVFGHIRSQNIDMAEDVDRMEAAMQQIERTYQGRTIILTLGNGNLTNHRFSIYNLTYKYNRYIMYDMFNYSVMPRYLTYLNSVCHCDATDPVAYFRWLSDHQVLYIGDSARYDLTSRYVRLVHGLDVEFRPEPAFVTPACLRDHEYKKMEVRVVKTAGSGITQ